MPVLQINVRMTYRHEKQSEGKRERERKREKKNLGARKWWKNVREVLVKLLRPWDCPVGRIRQGIAKSKGERG